MLAGFEVGEDIRAAEAVDGLLGIANQEQVILHSREHAREDVILQGVGVLKLVNEGCHVLPPQEGPQRGAAGARQAAVQARQQVVEELDLEIILPVRQPLPHKIERPQLDAYDVVRLRAG